MNETPESIRARAQAMAQAGDAVSALAVMQAGVKTFPQSAPLANSAGNFAMRAGDQQAAATLFAQAARTEPQSLEYAINWAIALSALERHAEALAALDSHRTAGEHDARYCSVRGAALRALGQLAEAERWYDRSLARDPANAKALHGRARIALERGESDAVARYEAALAANQMDPEAWLGLAEAKDAAGDLAGARAITEQLVGQAPHWIAALRFLAQLRLADGDSDFASHFGDAERMRPTDPAIARAHIAVLDSHDRFDDALGVAAAAHARFGEDEEMALLEAVQAGSAGEDARAQAIFERLALDTPERWLQEARHCVRVGEFARGEQLLDRMIAASPEHISAWAMRDLLWRRAGDPRADWLHGQDGLVQLVALPDADSVLADAIPLLHALHDSSAFPLGQSLRGGTQTRGNLFARTEPELARLHDALMAALDIYRSKLPPADTDHPLLRHRDAPWQITGSWSVRLDAGGDYHAAHLHPQGIVSSACYLLLPEDLGDGEGEQAGWIELGRPAPELRLDLEPLYTVQPKVGHLALFPSTLYHGTRPFGEGRRMTVAIDITMDERWAQ